MHMVTHFNSRHFFGRGRRKDAGTRGEGGEALLDKPGTDRRLVVAHCAHRCVAPRRTKSITQPKYLTCFSVIPMPRENWSAAITNALTTTNNPYDFQIDVDGKIFEHGCFSTSSFSKPGFSTTTPKSQPSQYRKRCKAIILYNHPRCLPPSIRYAPPCSTADSRTPYIA
jgi:hypothetical protein